MNDTVGMIGDKAPGIPAGGVSSPDQIPDVRLTKEQREEQYKFRRFKVDFSRQILARLNHPQAPITEQLDRNRCILDMWSGATIAFIVAQHKWGPLLMLQSHIIAQKGEEWLLDIESGQDDEATRTRL